MKRNLFLAFVIGSLSFTTLGATGCQPGGGGVGSLGANLSEGDACQAKGECGPGLECEIEHGAGVCKKHAEGGDDKGGQGEVGDDKGGKGDGGDDKGGMGQDDSPDGGGVDDKGGMGEAGDDKGGGGLPQGDCAVDADCGPGLECEVEHGVGTCKEHGGKK